ncbi:G-type lectin S-receptor-like serine/threonine-protein kinase At2g19130 [Panicum virgatum]|uniref:G-type lectin S-receptor-like serine/threonine-protein kinase At2g19130 n=1 Tax=Panicum virgatum TaxID=38727 RepID=UPI0019D5E492|nr:G-type lectin S-receptor-like serine/threonine-protein kinase At2g19130 [Panicum virgatum]
MIIWAEPHRLCDVYTVCGEFGVCNEKSELYCSCPAGFRPSSVADWELGDHSMGCRRNNPLRWCDGGANTSSVHGKGNGGDDDAFLLAPGVSLPRNPSPARASSAGDCRLACLRSCDCTAYSYDSHCSHGGLLNLQDTAGVDGLYLRLSAMDVPFSKGRRRTVVLASTVAVASFLAMSAIVSVVRWQHMPNGLLDKALFGGAPAPALSWRARFQVARGAARGLLYLHEGCRDCIIHCDIKPENILLDKDLVPKVADFGLAKLLRRDFSRVLTTVRGTIGYLAPEWISGVPVSAKADVYSYGMVLPEIISGRRNARCWPTAEQDSSSLSGYFPLVAARKMMILEKL